MQQKITAPTDKIGAADCAYRATFQRKGLFFYTLDDFPIFYSRRRLGSRQTNRQHTSWNRATNIQEMTPMFCIKAIKVTKAKPRITNTSCSIAEKTMALWQFSAVVMVRTNWRMPPSWAV